MFNLIVIICAKTHEDVDTIAHALARMRPMCLDEPGCASWDAFQTEEDPQRFVLVEQWETRAHWEAHGDLDAIQTVYMRDVFPRITREVLTCHRLGVST